MKKFHGTGVALVTPFHADGSIDYPGLKKVLDHTAQGVDYYVVQGTTGEGSTITAADKAAILQFVKDNNPKKLPIVFGIGGNDTAVIVNRFASYDLTGVDAVLSVAPYYNKPTDEGFYRHFVAVADASPVPIILYNVPGRTAQNMSAEVILRLAEHPNIIGIYSSAAGNEGLLRVFQSRPELPRPLVVAHELTPLSRKALGEGLFDAVISQDSGHLVRSAVRVMRANSDRMPINSAQERIRIDVYLKENMPP